MIKDIRLFVDGILKTCQIEKTILGYNEEEELDNLVLKTVVDGVEYANTKEFSEIEYAIVDLQKQLPDNIQVACCLSCKYGNFCPYGNAQNEIFCLINFSPKNKVDVIDIFDSIGNENNIIKELLFWCERYQIADAAYYTYNDWMYHFKSE